MPSGWTLRGVAMVSQQVELFQAGRQVRQEPAGVSTGLRRLAGLAVGLLVVLGDDEPADRRVELGEAQQRLPGPVGGAAWGVAEQGGQAPLVDGGEEPLDLPAPPGPGPAGRTPGGSSGRRRPAPSARR
jgi:hypothetical protein